MHSSRMCTTCSSSSLLEGVCLSACWDTSPRCGPGDPPGCGPGDPLVWAWIPPDVGLGICQVWAWRPPGCQLDTPSVGLEPPRHGPGDPPWCGPGNPLGVDLETPLHVGLENCQVWTCRPLGVS